MTHISSARRASLTLVALSAIATPLATRLAAQLPNASAAAFGLAGNFTAGARGADAAAWNPANLGLGDTPAFSLRALTVGGISGLNPITWNDFAGHGDATIPRDTRLGWVDRVTASGRQTGDADGGATALALNVGRVGLHVGAAGYAAASLSPDAIEALFFGNAGRTGAPRDLRFDGSSARGGAFGTAALSYAQPLHLDPARHSELAIGVTAKYVSGAGVLRAQDGGSSVTTSDVAVNFPIVYSDGMAGSGFGVDVGAAFRSGRLTLGAKVENAMNSFAWDAAHLKYRAGAASFDGTTSTSDFDERPYGTAPAALRDAVESEHFAPTIGGGLAFRQSSALTITADARQQIGDDRAITLGPKTHVGLGLESRALGILPLRAGAAYVTGGWQVAGGAGLRVGGVELSAGYALRKSERGRGAGVMLNVLSVR